MSNMLLRCIDSIDALTSLSCGSSQCIPVCCVAPEVDARTSCDGFADPAGRHSRRSEIWIKTSSSCILRPCLVAPTSRGGHKEI